MSGEHPEWLPEGWRVSVKVRSFGRKDKYYSHPSNGLTFNSKPEVLRYLENPETSRKRKETNKINIEMTVAEGLPPGWIKEIRTKKKGGKTRRDLYYIDPVSGCQFRSMPEVFRHLKSKDSVEAESKPDDKIPISMEPGDHPQSSSAEAKGQELIDKKGDEILSAHESAKTGPDVALLKDIEEPVLEQTDGENDTVVENIPKKVPQVNGKEQRNGGRRQSGRLANSKLKDNVAKDQLLQSGTETIVEKNINIPLEQRQKENSRAGEGEEQQNLSCQNKRKNSKYTRDLPRRTSKRLARAETDPPTEGKTSKKVSGDGEVITTKNVGESGTYDEPEINTTGKSGKISDSKKHPLTYPTNNEQKRSISDENVSPLEEHKGAGLGSKEDRMDPDSSLKDLLMDPCIEFAIKTLTGAIPIEDVNRVSESSVSSLASPNQASPSPSMLPSEYIWSDPCFEFAVKTLTGETPANEIPSEKPLSSSGVGACNNLSSSTSRLDSVYPSTYSHNPVDASSRRSFEGRKGNFM